MNVLITNDDGIYSPGLWALAEAVKELAKVTIVAPDRHQSGAGFSITAYSPVKVVQVPSRLEGVRAFAIEGTPADSLLLGHQALVEGSLDLLIASINDGANLGSNVMMSGTVGAAFQAQLLGVPGTSVSVAGSGKPVLAPVAQLGKELAQLFLGGKIREPPVPNVNVPGIAVEEIQGADLTRLASTSETALISVQEPVP